MYKVSPILTRSSAETKDLIGHAWNIFPASMFNTILHMLIITYDICFHKLSCKFLGMKICALKILRPLDNESDN